jgi:ArsR family transcriptional regulator
MAARAEEVGGLLRLLAHPGRLRLVCRLVEGEASVGGLERELGIRQPNLSQQLTVLRRAGIVHSRRQAKQVVYGLAQCRVARLIAALHEIYCTPEKPQ